MSSQNDGIIVILSSPSGAGKTTLVKLLSQRKNFNISVSHTTREPRSNEIEGWRMKRIMTMENSRQTTLEEFGFTFEWMV